MAKVQKFILQDFNKPVESELSVSLPSGSKPLKVSSYPDGLYLWAEVPSLEVMTTETHKFHNLMKDADIPANAEYFTTLEIFQEVPTEEGPQIAVMVNHIYKYK